MYKAKILLLFTIIFLVRINCTRYQVLVNKPIIDFDYKLILKDKNHYDELLIKYLEQEKETREKSISLAINMTKEIQNLNNKSLESYICLEILAPHAGEPMIFWAAEVDGKVYFISVINIKFICISSNVRFSKYETFENTISSWEELVPDNNTKGDLESYYVGVVTLYKPNFFKQLKITYNEISKGRVGEILKTIENETGCNF